MADPTMRLEKITPEIAASWLALNEGNRPFLERYMFELAGAMSRGEWKVSNDAITFDTTGRLINGQHRLQAVIKTGITITAWVMENADPSSFQFMDRGKKRSFADVLAIRGVADQNTVANAVRWVVRLESADPFRKMAELTNEQLLQAFEAHPGLIRGIAITRPSFRLAGSKGMPVALHYVMALKSESFADQFFNLLGNGANLPAEHPVLTLRERLSDNRAARARLPAEEVAVLIVRAWNAFATNRRLSHVRVRVEKGVFPEIVRPSWTGETEEPDTAEAGS